MRFQSAQLDAYLTDRLWLRLAARANDGMARLVSGLIDLGIQPIHYPRANMVFVQAEPSAITSWEAAGISLFRMAERQARFVTNFRTTPDVIDEALARINACMLSS